MSKSRDRVYDAIVKHTKEKGYAPTIREICDLVNLKSTSTVHSHIKNLIKEGKLHSKDFSPRTLVSPNLQVEEIPQHQLLLAPNNIKVLEVVDGVPTLWEWGGHIYELKGKAEQES